MNLNFLQKYYGFYLMEYQRVKLYVPDIVVRTILITLRLVMPYSIFYVLVTKNQISQETANAMVWAVLVGQIMNASSSKIHKRIKEDIRSGDISTRLSEPVNYIWSKLFQSFGHFVPTFIIYSTIFFSACAIIFPTKINIPILFIFTLLSFVLICMIEVLLGLTSFILEENSGLWWITAKMFFIFGNQIIPVALMPASVIAFAKFTPFYLGLAAPIEAASGRLNIFQGLGLSIFYIIFFMFIAQWMLSSLQKRLVING